MTDKGKDRDLKTSLRPPPKKRRRRRVNINVEPETRQALIAERERRNRSFSRIVSDALRSWLRLPNPDPEDVPKYRAQAPAPESNQELPGGMIRIQITLPGDLHAAVGHQAPVHDVSRAEIIRWALREFLGLESPE